VLLIEDINADIRAGVGASHSPLYLTHTVATKSRGGQHTIRLYRPNPANGPLAGTLVAALTLSPEQAAELKAHL
jgi:hypothetical protein